MDYPQIINTPNGEQLAVLPLKEYERLRALDAPFDDEDEDGELREDVRLEIEATLARIKSGKEKTIPGDVVHAQIDGMHPVRAWRDYKGWTAEKLAKKAGITRVYLTQIENGKRKGPVKVYKALAKALGCSVDWLVR